MSEACGPEVWKPRPNDPPELHRLWGNDVSINLLQQAINSEDTERTCVPSSLEEVLTKRAWEDRIQSYGKKRIAYAAFVDFVEAPKWDGLGTTLADLKAIISIDKDTARAGRLRDLIDEMEQRPVGNPMPSGHNQYTKQTAVDEGAKEGDRQRGSVT